MKSNVLAAARALGLDTRAAVQSLFARSIDAALAEQDLSSLCDSLRAVVPDLRDQYTCGFDPVEYKRLWERKTRGMHAFQVRCTLDALARFERGGLVVADIGDSSGTHSAYMRALSPGGTIGRTIGVNTDAEAVARIRAKGGEGVLCRAEDLVAMGIEADLFVCFETLEHLVSPVGFLHTLASHAGAEYLLVTVPYRRCSRFGGALLRQAEPTMPERLSAESLHIHEFSPEDWSLLARFSGFRTEFLRIYRQYPLKSPLRATAPLWRRLDFEGFVALLLKRDLSVAQRYDGW